MKIIFMCISLLTSINTYADDSDCITVNKYHCVSKKVAENHIKRTADIRRSESELIDTMHYQSGKAQAFSGGVFSGTVALALNKNILAYGKIDSGSSDELRAIFYKYRKIKDHLEDPKNAHIAVNLISNADDLSNRVNGPDKFKIQRILANRKNAVNQLRFFGPKSKAALAVSAGILLYNSGAISSAEIIGDKQEKGRYKINNGLDEDISLEREEIAQ